MNYLIVGSISACIVVILGAFGAHVLKNVLDDYGRSIYEKAVLYHMFHTIGIMILGILNKVQTETQFSITGWLFLIGIILFSGSLYLIAITGIKSLGIVTPIGGLLLIIGWISFIIKVM